MSTQPSAVTPDGNTLMFHNRYAPPPAAAD
jgi:hypothetical protein